MRRLALCLAFLLTTTAAAAESYSTGAAFRHYAPLAGCGTPISGVTWTASSATQHFRRCSIVARYRVIYPTATPGPKTPTPQPSPTRAPLPTATSSPSTPEQYLLGLINGARAQAGLAPYRLDAQESPCSLAHSQHMEQEGYISHDQFPGDLSCVSGWTTAGENVAMGTADEMTVLKSTFDAMMAEQPPNDGHRANILSPTFTKVGLGIYVQNGTWVTEDFTNG